MIRRKDRNLHVVREQEDPTDRIVREILEELNSENDLQRDADGSGRKRRKTPGWKLRLGLILLAAASIGVYLLVNLQTYSRVRITET